ncbi:unnamed protein product [Arabis nemorensis]|uniref:Uncharacterized protein n=1 Tax=Arabis nemorensis TaxID=586526 RepID=A0A565BUS8_9BRAS|nr:unnamed protein product [Arabis nemorensis]
MVLVNLHSDGQPLIINKSVLNWYLIRMRNQTRNQQSEPIQDPNLPGLPGVNLLDQDEDLENQDQRREDWVISIKDKMEIALRDGAITSWDKLCIYRVPPYLQENNEKSYFPQTVSLGPYHHGKTHLLPMELHKWRAVNMIMERTGQGIELYIDAMKELEEKARACYQGPITLSINKFTEILVVDGCFVLELLRGTVEGFQQIGYARNDAVFAMRGLMHSIQRDMVMLENQLPLRGVDQTKPVKTQALARKILGLTWRQGDLHCLDVFRQSLLEFHQSSNPRSQDTLGMNLVDKRQQQLVHCVTELREAGVKFKTRKTHQFWDIRFENGCLEIPKLVIHDGTKPLFLNLIAFEQCHIDSSNDITSYIIFMDNLINSAEDVSYLHQCGIIEHWLGSDAEVADLFNRLCQEVFFDPRDSYLSQLSDDVNRYYSRKWNVLKATLRHKYFNNPWAYFSFFAAVILLMLTLFQSFYAVYAYYKPHL